MVMVYRRASRGIKNPTPHMAIKITVRRSTFRLEMLCLLLLSLFSTACSFLSFRGLKPRRAQEIYFLAPLLCSLSFVVHSMYRSAEIFDQSGQKALCLLCRTGQPVGV